MCDWLTDVIKQTGRDVYEVIILLIPFPKMAHIHEFREIRKNECVCPAERSFRGFEIELDLGLWLGHRHSSVFRSSMRWFACARR
ncbi:MAG: hypothetical protein QOJ39_3119 [Candidatus Eremiobacteraeota bacterium]|nr:hypothetical protein [Candidatus Eremiobacteraeota bacterium]